MTTTISSRGKQGALLMAGILMIATTLRVTFTGAAPLLDSIRNDYGLTTAQTGMLTTLPLLAFALVSPLAAGIARRLGMERSLFAAMLLICAGIAIRSLPHRRCFLLALPLSVAASRWGTFCYQDSLSVTSRSTSPK